MERYAMVRGEVRERIEKLRGRIATANESPHTLLGDARNCRNRPTSGCIVSRDGTSGS